MKFFLLFSVLFISSKVNGPVNCHNLVGHWTFEDGQSLVDLTGNFGNISLNKGAVIENGQLNVGIDLWAYTEGAYTGPPITEKTLVTWASIDSFPSSQAGSILAIDELSSDQFDSIVFGEIKANYWMAGSSHFYRTIDPVPGYMETKTDVMFQLAISYEKESGNQAHVRLYRNGELFGDYIKGYLETWSVGDTEAIWGPRHYYNNIDEAQGDVDAHIEESRIYGEVLDSEDLRRLYPIVDRSVCLGNHSDGDLKLDNSTSPPLLMMCSQGKWGYICGADDDPESSSPWTLKNIGVACQQMGYIREDSYIPVPELTEQVSVVYPVLYRSVYCTGIEKRLIDCTYGSTDVHHGHCKIDNVFKYGAASCSKKHVICNSPGEIKLVDNMLQICSQGEWYSACGDTGTWTNAQAEVACRQLGLNPNGSLASSVPGTNNYTLDISFHCTGSEGSLVECSSSTVALQCTSKAAVICGLAPSSSTSSISSSTLLSLTSSAASSSCPVVTIYTYKEESTPAASSRTFSDTLLLKRSSASSAVGCSNSPANERQESSFLQSSDSVVDFAVGLVVGMLICASPCGTIMVVMIVLLRKRNKEDSTRLQLNAAVNNPVYGGKESDEENVYANDDFDLIEEKKDIN